MTIYYVKNGGSDPADGLSDANAWATSDKVEGFSFSTSDQVFFKCGDTWTFTGTNNLKIVLKGTSGNRAVLGAYYLDGGTETRGVSGNKPIFNGPYDGANPGGPDSGLIFNHTLGECDYLTVENFKLTNSDFRGVSFERQNTIILDSIDLDTIYLSALLIDDSDNSTIQDCTLIEGGRAAEDEGRHPASVRIAHSDGGLIQRVTIDNSYGGEAISFFATSSSASKASKNCIAQDNSVYAFKDGPFYYCNRGQDHIFRRNVAVGAPIGSPYRGSDRRLFAMADEPGFDAAVNSNIEWSNNLGAAGSAGIWISAPASRSSMDNHKFVYNTLVDCDIYFHSPSSSWVSAVTTLIQNNIFQDHGYGGTMYFGPSSLPGNIDMDYNSWSSSPGSPASGANDVIGNALLKKQAGWNDIQTSGDVDFEDFRPDGASPVEDQGVAISGVTIDYESNSTGTPPNIGSFETLGGEDPQPPPPPIGSGGISIILKTLLLAIIL